jgi:DNA-binding MarR family transcriptional regulator
MSVDPSIQVRPQLSLLLLSAQHWVMTSLLRLMAERGHSDLTAAHLMFLSNLDCGDTYASEVARRMGVTRQAVYRSTQELQRLKVLKLQNDESRKNHKIIRMTKHGQHVVLDARYCFAEIEATLSARIGARDVEKLGAILAKDWGEPLGDG